MVTYVLKNEIEIYILHIYRKDDNTFFPLKLHKDKKKSSPVRCCKGIGSCSPARYVERPSLTPLYDMQRHDRGFRPRLTLATDVGTGYRAFHIKRVDWLDGMALWQPPEPPYINKVDWLDELPRRAVTELFHINEVD